MQMWSHIFNLDLNYDDDLLKLNVDDLIIKISSIRIFCLVLYIRYFWILSVILAAIYPLYFSCSICVKKQNKHFIVPNSKFKLLQVSSLIAKENIVLVWCSSNLGEYFAYLIKIEREREGEEGGGDGDGGIMVGE